MIGSSLNIKLIHNLFKDRVLGFLGITLKFNCSSQKPAHLKEEEKKKKSMATAMGMLGNVGGCGSASASWIRLRNCSKKKKKGENIRFGVSCVYSPSVSDPYKTLRIQPGASESEVRKAFRQLALQYHPDVCRGSNCGIQFHQINDAYDTVMSNLRGETKRAEMEINEEYDDDESMRGMNDPDWDMWEEWMGWEGAGIRDYSSHINPYI